MRQIVLDTETTGRETALGNRILEIGCIELNNRRFTNKHYHQYINPGRASEAGALAVHGITEEFLADKPTFNLIIEEFLDFIKDAELIIHNAPFDIGFLNYELSIAGKKYGKITDYCTVFDTLPLARQMHPGQRNSLDALCKRYSVDNTQRNLHGGLLDAELLAKVYLAMTGGQTTLFATEEVTAPETTITQTITTSPMQKSRPELRIITADTLELAAHTNRIAAIDKSSGGKAFWKTE